MLSIKLCNLLNKMRKVKKYDGGIGAAASGAADALSGMSGTPGAGGNFANFMQNYGGPAASVLTSLTPLFMKKPKLNAKPYKKGTKLIKYQNATESLQLDPNKVIDTNQFTDPTVKALFREYQAKQKKQSGSAIAPLETLRVGVPSDEETAKQILKEQGEGKETEKTSKGTSEKPKEKSKSPITYSPLQSGLLGTASGVLKSLKTYSGRGSSVLNPIGKWGLRALPLGAAISTWNEDETEGLVDKAKNVGLQTIGDLAAIAMGRKTPDVFRTYKNKRAEAKKQFNEKFQKVKEIENPRERSKEISKLNAPSRFSLKSLKESIIEEGENALEKIPGFFTGLFDKLTSENVRELNKLKKQSKQESKKTREEARKRLNQREENKRKLLEEEQNKAKRAEQARKAKTAEKQKNKTTRDAQALALAKERIDQQSPSLESVKENLAKKLISWNSPKPSNAVPAEPLVLIPPGTKKRTRKK